MEYWIQSKIDTILQELNIYYSNLITNKIKEIKNSYTIEQLNKNELLAISIDILKGYKQVTIETDRIINNITEKEFQTLVTNIYEHFPTIKT